MELCVHIRVLIIPIHTQRLYWLAAVDVTSGYSTLHLDANYPTMCSAGSEFRGAQQQSGAPEVFRAQQQSGAPVVTVHSDNIKVPIVEVACRYDVWWSIPQNISAHLIDKYMNGEDARYTWFAEDASRTEPKVNQYEIDFATGVQTNLDTQRKRSIRIIWAKPQDVKAQFKGQMCDASELQCSYNAARSQYKCDMRLDEHNRRKVPIVEVAFGCDKWWSLPQELSAQLYDSYVSGHNPMYTRSGQEPFPYFMAPQDPDGVNRYIINFVTSVQTNIDDLRKRSIRLIWVRPEVVKPQFTDVLPMSIED